MFTGIVEEVGRVTAVDTRGAAARLTVACALVVQDAQLGASIAVNGCCLTVTDFDAAGFSADLMSETLGVTALGELAPGAGVNLERPLALGARLGGHLVQGHVDGVGRVVQRDEAGPDLVLTIAAPPTVLRYVVRKGSITIQGVSLTVVDVDAEHLRVALIPHTLEVTTLGALGAGAAVNLEVDVVAKYVERLVTAGALTPYAGSPSGDAGATMEGS